MGGISSLLLLALTVVSLTFPVSEMAVAQAKVAAVAKKTQEKDPRKLFCQKMAAEFKRYHWGQSPCEENHWVTVRKSVQGNPLVWTVFGAEHEKTPQEKVNTTMIFCGVHGDEITPIKFCFDIIEGLKKNYASLYSEKMIIVAPLVNPDSFFKKRPTRTNANGVDINRNFPTSNWKSMAQHLWKNYYHRDPRRNPGPSPLSEPEVVFQINLIKRYRPDKIISVHSPLTMLDYDGPISNPKKLNIAEIVKKDEEDREEKIAPAKNIFSQKKNEEIKIEEQLKEKSEAEPIIAAKNDETKIDMIKGKKAYDLLLTMSQMADDYRIRQFRTYPGSLGNWAGLERKIPTYTLELPSSDPDKTDPFWKLFEKAIHEAIINSVDEETTAAEAPASGQKTQGPVPLTVDDKKSSSTTL